MGAILTNDSTQIPFHIWNGTPTRIMDQNEHILRLGSETIIRQTINKVGSEKAINAQIFAESSAEVDAYIVKLLQLQDKTKRWQLSGDTTPVIDLIISNVTYNVKKVIGSGSSPIDGNEVDIQWVIMVNMTTTQDNGGD